MKHIGVAIGLFSALALSGCVAAEKETDWPHFNAFAPEMNFPADRSLSRPEDGVITSDGRLIVADQVEGLRLVESDGSSRRFGRMKSAGYEHDPPQTIGAPNGVSLEPGGSHILVADVYRGGIYRIEVESEKTERVYQHPFGVNTAVADSSGGIWFTQSTRNRPERGEEELFRAVDVGRPDGALFYLPPSHGDEGKDAVQLVDGLSFANGVVLDEGNGHIYVCETTGDRVLRFDADVAKGTVANRTVALNVFHPDNVELDSGNRLWVALPLMSEIIVFDPSSQTDRSMFRVSTQQSERLVEGIKEKAAAGDSWIEAMVPTLWEPAPGLMTGIILSSSGDTVYSSGLGDALIKLQPERR